MRSRIEGEALTKGLQAGALECSRSDSAGCARANRPAHKLKPPRLLLPSHHHHNMSTRPPSSASPHRRSTQASTQPRQASTNASSTERDDTVEAFRQVVREAIAPLATQLKNMSTSLTARLDSLERKIDLNVRGFRDPPAGPAPPADAGLPLTEARLRDPRRNIATPFRPPSPPPNDPSSSGRFTSVADNRPSSSRVIPPYRFSFTAPGPMLLTAEPPPVGTTLADFARASAASNAGSTLDDPDWETHLRPRLGPRAGRSYVTIPPVPDYLPAYIASLNARTASLSLSANANSSGNSQSPPPPYSGRFTFRSLPPS